MVNGATSTIASLVFRAEDDIDFARFVGELAKALGGDAALSTIDTTRPNDLTIFELGTARVGLGLCVFKRDCPGFDVDDRFGKMLVISIGSSPELPGEGPIYDGRRALIRGLVDLVEKRHKSTKYVWFELAQVFSEDVFEMLVDQFAPALSHGNPMVGKSNDISLGLMSPDQIFTALSASFEAETRFRDPEQMEQRKLQRRRARPSLSQPLPEQFIPAIPRNPGPRGTMRAALYPSEAELETMQQRPSTIRRIGIYALNGAVIALSLPIGAALMIYSFFGHEDLSNTSRGLAMSGTLFGLREADVAEAVVRFFS